jgi:hypothetical protein
MYNPVYAQNDKEVTNMKRITWTPDTKMKIAKRAHQLITDPLFVGRKIEAVRQAQKELLPSTEHRPLISMQEVSKWADPIWAELDAQGPSKPTAIQPVVDHRAEAHYQAKQLVLSELSTEELLGEFMKRVTDLTSERRIRTLVQEQVSIELERSIPGWKPVRYIEEPEVIKVSAKPHVLILGLMEDQKQIIETKYRGKLDLHFKTGAEGARHVKSLVENMDMTIKTKWCKGHLGSTSGWPNFTTSNGGISEVQRLLNMRFKIESIQ